MQSEAGAPSANVHVPRGSRFGANRANKGAGGGAGGQPPKQPNGTNVPSHAPYSPTMSIGGYGGSSEAGGNEPPAPEPTKFFFQEKYAKLGVRGNFMPLAAQPKNVDLGDWLAHQCRS